MSVKENSDIKNSVKKGFGSKLVYIKKYLKTKMKYYEGKSNTNFDCDKVPKEGSQCICVSVILIDSVFRIGKTYYPDVLLEKFK